MPDAATPWLTSAPAADHSSPTGLSTVPDPLPSTSVPFRAQDIPQAAPEFIFTAQIPQTWQTEAIDSVQAISLYDPTLSGNNSLEKSQIFIRFFTAADFLTLSTVTIHSRTPLTVAGRPAVRYDIAKKPNVADFPHQPSWRNERHEVTDVRVSNENPSVFYVIAKRPDLKPQIYESFLNSINVGNNNTALIQPVAEFASRITKKPFGIFITPDTSPIQPERFTGYHTGVDVEYGDVAAEVSIQAVMPGIVHLSQTISGYGGIVAIEHQIEQSDVMTIYGHLNPSNLAPAGKKVTAGETIGILGAGGTLETDYERKHLHFAVLTSAKLDLRGYVPTQDELRHWRNPQELF